MIKNRLEFTNKVLFIIFFAFPGVLENCFPLVDLIRRNFWLNLSLFSSSFSCLDHLGGKTSRRQVTGMHAVHRRDHHAVTRDHLVIPRILPQAVQHGGDGLVSGFILVHKMRPDHAK